MSIVIYYKFYNFQNDPSNKEIQFFINPDQSISINLINPDQSGSHPIFR